MGAGPGKGPSEVGLSKGLTGDGPDGAGGAEGLAAADGLAEELAAARGVGPVIVVGVESEETGVGLETDAAA